MKCDVCEKLNPWLYERGELSVCVKCNEKLCEYCAQTTEHRRIPITNDAGYVAMVCPVCTLETALRMFYKALSYLDEDSEITCGAVDNSLDGCKFVSLAIKSLKGE